MLLSPLRSISRLNWLLTFLAVLVWLPQLSGTEPPSASKPPRPTAVVVDVQEVPDSDAALPATPPAAANPDETKALRLLGPLEADLEDEPAEEPPAAAAPNAPRLPALGDIESEEVVENEAVESGVTPLEVQPSPVPPSIPFRRTPPLPPKESREPAAKQPSVPQAAAPSLTAPPQPFPKGAPAVAGSAVRYWVVSTRCCSQKSHRCGTACRFVCHMVTEDCRVHPVCYEDLLSSLMPAAPTCVFVHGSFTRWQDVWQDAEFTFRWLRAPCPHVPLNFIYFTWPSEGVLALASNNAFTSPVPGIDFAVLGRRAENNGFYLADFVGSLPPQNCVSLVGHSFGARTIAAGLHLLGGGTIRQEARWNPADCGNRIRVVLAAAAIDHDWLNPEERYGCALNRAECLLNLRNECDLALALYPLRRPFSSRSLARAGFTRKDHRELGQRGCQVAELDVTELIGKSHGWPHYVRRPQIAAAITPFIYFEHAAPAVEQAQMPR